MINYYALLGLSQNADDATIRDTIKKERRRWNQRASHPKQEIRTEAEQRVREISQAEGILLDPERRAEYNQTLSSNPNQQSGLEPPMPSQTGEKNWLDILKYYMNINNYNSAAYAAREAVQQQPNNPEAWFWKALISSDMSNYSDAEFELNEAVRLDPSNLDYQYELGSLYMDVDRYPAALSQFIKVQEINKDFYKPDAFLRLRIRCLWGMKKFPIAYPIITEYYNRCGGNHEVGDMYANFISDMILDAWSVDDEGARRITNWNQYNFTKQWIQVLNNIPVYDRILRDDIANTNHYIQRAEQRFDSKSDAMNVADSLFSHGIAGAIGALGGTLYAGRKMQWEWTAEGLPYEVLHTGLQ